MPEGLNPGDKVVALAAAATTAAVVAGAISGVIAVWLTKHNALASFGGFIVGAFLGRIAGTLIGWVLFPASGGNVIVVKWGPSSLPLTLKGNIIASLFASALVCGLVVLVGKAQVSAIAGPCIGTSVIIGVILAFLVSLI